MANLRRPLQFSSFVLVCPNSHCMASHRIQTRAVDTDIPRTSQITINCSECCHLFNCCHHDYDGDYCCYDSNQVPPPPPPSPPPPPPRRPPRLLRLLSCRSVLLLHIVVYSPSFCAVLCSKSCTKRSTTGTCLLCHNAPCNRQAVRPPGTRVRSELRI